MQFTRRSGFWREALAQFAASAFLPIIVSLFVILKVAIVFMFSYLVVLVSYLQAHSFRRGHDVA
jgi:hypothetical protein